MTVFRCPFTASDDQEFIFQIYHDYREMMYRISGRLVSDPHAQEVIVQDSLVKLIRNIDTLREKEPPVLTAYIAATIRNTVWNYHKHQGVVRKHTVLWDETACDIVSDSHSMDDLLILAERSSAFSRIWNLLPDEPKTLLEGKYILHLTDAELAEQFGCKPASIRMKLTRAKRQLAKLLKEHGEGLFDEYTGSASGKL